MQEKTTSRSKNDKSPPKEITPVPLMKSPESVIDNKNP
jgi:hypothetical protein